MKYSVIIPTCSSDRGLLNDVISLIYEKNSNRNEYEIIIVSNGQSDDVNKFLLSKSKEYDNFKVLIFDKPLGYSRAINIGVSNSSGEYLVLYNDDLYVYTDDWLDRMFDMFSEDERIGATGINLYWSLVKSEEYFGMFHAFVFIAFTLVMLKRKVFEELGGLDESYLYAGVEDVDFCYRMILRGYIFSYSHLLYRHIDKHSRSKDSLWKNYENRNTLFFFNKNRMVFSSKTVTLVYLIRKFVEIDDINKIFDFNADKNYNTLFLTTDLDFYFKWHNVLKKGSESFWKDASLIYIKEYVNSFTEFLIEVFNLTFTNKVIIVSDDYYLEIRILFISI